METSCLFQGQQSRMMPNPGLRQILQQPSGTSTQLIVRTRIRIFFLGYEPYQGQIAYYSFFYSV